MTKSAQSRFVPSTLFLAWLFWLVVSPTNPAVGRSHQEKPNLIFIMADDLGLGDVKCFGQDLSRAETPNIDQLARSGMMFTDAHAPVAHCIPTRVAIMTGSYQFRLTKDKRFGPWGYLYPQFPSKQLTLAQVLKRQGYHSAYIGKWHLGLEMKTTDGKPQGPENVDYSKPVALGPNDRGFDESFILPGSLDMFPYVFLRNQQWIGNVNSRKGWSAFNRVGPAADDFEDTKVLDTFSTEAESFLKSRAGKDQPFFLYLSLTSPHTPTSPSANFKGKSKLGLYGDFLMETDHCVGRVLNALKKYRLDKDTLVVFTSDHGAASYAGNIAKATESQYLKMQQLGHFSNSIYRGFKFSAYEGGTRIPLIVHWPGRVAPGTTSPALIGLNDVMATFAEIAGARLTPNEAPDSISFYRTLVDSQVQPNREWMICRSTHHFTIRHGDWKLLLCPGSGCGGRWGNKPPRNDAWRQAVKNFGRSPARDEIRNPAFCQLFNLRDDPTESRNLSTKHPEKIKELGTLLDRAIQNGRSRPGPAIKSTRTVNPLHDVPKFVWGGK